MMDDLKILLVLLAMLGAGIALVLPRRWTGVFGVLSALALFSLWTALRRDTSYYSLVAPIFLLVHLGLAFSMVVAIVLKWIAIIRRRLRGRHSTPIAKISVWPLMTLLLGGLAPVYVVVVRSFFRGASAADVMALFLASTLLPLALYLAVNGRLRRPGIGRAPLLMLAVSLAVSGTMVTGWSLLTARSVYAAAVSEAGVHAFCMQVQNRGGFRAASGWLDLSPFTMRADDPAGRAFERHAYLVVAKPEDVWVGYWSYSRGAFIPRDPDRPDAGMLSVRSQIVCTPSQDGFAPER